MKSAHDLVAETKLRVNEISVAAAESAIRNTDVLIDVREAHEFASGHIPGAVHVSRGMIEFKFSSDPALAARDLKIILYCKSSGRAALVSNSLREMGYLSVASIAGGIDAWAASGKPIVKPEVISFN